MPGKQYTPIMTSPSRTYSAHEGERAENVAVIQEKWTRKGGRIEVKHGKGKDTFEFDDSTEQACQLRNARYLAQQLLDTGGAKYVVDEIAKTRHDSFSPVVKDGYVHAEVNRQDIADENAKRERERQRD